MPIDHTDTLSEVLMDVLEKFAFMFADEVDLDTLPDPEAEVMLTQMTFVGEFNGGLVLAVPTPMGKEIASNLLGTDPNDANAANAARDAVQEVLNVVCGRVLTEIAGEKPVFDLSMPVVSDMPEETWALLKTLPNTVGFMVDDYPVLLHADIDNA